MTQVDFYILSSDSPEARLKIACRLADKAVQSELGVFVLVESEHDAHRLDELLWTFAQNSFLPHRLAWNTAADSIAEPVVIGLDEHATSAFAGSGDSDDWGLMINLAPAVPEAFGRYERLAEIVDSTPEIREQGRERFRFYRDRGYALQTHHV